MPTRDERKQQSRQALLEAALQLSTSGRSFSSLSLREVAREVGLVPTAFYRHFQDMNELGLEIVDQVALFLKHILHQMSHDYFKQPNMNAETSMVFFFQAVEKNAAAWIFMIAERWGGSVLLRDAIAREIKDLTDGLCLDLKQIKSMQHIKNEQDLYVLAQTLIDMSFTWAMSWISLNRQFQDENLSEKQQLYIQQAVIQVQLLFRGIANWQ